MNPQDSVSLKRILNTPERGIGKTSIQYIEDYALEYSLSFHDVLMQLHTGIVKLTPKATTGLESFVRTLHDIRVKLPSLAPADCIETMVKAIKYRDYLVKEEGGEAQADEKYENI